MGGLASDIDAAAAAAKAAAVGALGVRGGVGGWVEGAELGAAPNRAADNIPEGLGCCPGDLESKSFSCLESGKMVRISFKMGATTAEAKETAFGKKIDENVQAMLCPTNFNLLLANKERSHKLNSHTGGNWPQDLS